MVVGVTAWCGHHTLFFHKVTVPTGLSLSRDVGRLQSMEAAFLAISHHPYPRSPLILSPPAISSFLGGSDVDVVWLCVFCVFPICALGPPILTPSGARGWDQPSAARWSGTVVPGVTFVAVRSSYSYAAPDRSVATLVFDLGSLR